MKKILIPLIASLAISGSCFAAGVTQSFAAEEKMADTVVSALTGDSVTYEKARKHFSSNLEKNITADRFTNMKKQIQNQIGTVKDPVLVSLTRQYHLQNGFNNVHDLVYYGSAGKGSYVRIVVSFTEEKGQRRVSAFNVTPINPQQQQQRMQPQQQRVQQQQQRRPQPQQQRMPTMR